MHFSTILPTPYCLDYRNFIVIFEIKHAKCLELPQDYFGYLRSFALPFELLNHFIDIDKVTCLRFVGFALNRSSWEEVLF